MPDFLRETQFSRKVGSPLTISAESLSPEADERTWTRVLSAYARPSDGRSAFELVVTLVPLLVLWAGMLVAVGLGFWWALVLTVPAGGFLVRLFMIQHDCGHGAFFRTRRLNDWLGRALSVLTLTPYDYWRRTHGAHHATAGNLDRRGVGDVATLTVREYLDLPWWGRLRYRLYRNPLVMFGLGPVYVFFIQHRLPFGLMRSGARPWLSTMGTNVALAVIIGLMIWAVGPTAFLAVWLPITLLAGAAGVWLFYVQHQYEGTFWAPDEEWTFHRGALHGSSHYDLPGILRWFTANIGIHHVHHLASRIPFYRLPEVLRDYPKLRGLSRVTIVQSLRGVRLALWDEARRELVSFSDMSRRLAQQAA